MATDNKINATNSWNFALIDYFHDMSLLKEGDGVNFQKASCTLDGCVKIYTSRVDSVATETGKLLSGLADGQNKKGSRNEGSQDQEGEEEDDSENEDAAKKRSKKKATRSSEATLVNDFASLQLKKFELEFAVDPLFKKASADFDEGGAKGLLLNHLAIDAQGRIVFDSSDDADEEAQQEDDATEVDTEEAEIEDKGVIATDSTSIVAQKIDIAALKARFFPNLESLEGQDICPSLKNLDLGDPASALDIPFLKDAAAAAAAAEGNSSDLLEGQDGLTNFEHSADDDDDGNTGGFDVLEDVPFGQGGDIWAQEAVLESQTRQQGQEYSEDGVDGGEPASGDIGVFDANSSQYGIGFVHGKKELQHENILSYFDNTLSKNWAGPENWKIQKVKDSDKQTTVPTKRKEKEAFEIDFLSPLDPSLADTIYTLATSASTITLPKSQQKSRTRNLLPDDKHFNSRQLLSLFLKPKARLGSRKQLSRPKPDASREIDPAYWATKDATAIGGPQEEEEAAALKGDYDADFFQDDAIFPTSGLPDDDDEDFADAREHLSPAPDTTAPGSQSLDAILTANPLQAGAFGSHLVTQSNRLRPEYVQYARVAKKVDIRRLKDEIWKGMAEGMAEGMAGGNTIIPTEVNPTSFNPNPHFSNPLQPTSTPTSDGPSTTSTTVTPLSSNEQEAPILFTSLMQGLKKVYPKQAIEDISTSFCFISLLHLANEKGLMITSLAGLEELSICLDRSAVVTGVE